MTTLADAPVPSTAPDITTPTVQVVVEYWTVTMGGQASCGSCDETLTALHDAVDTIHPLAARLGVTVDVRPRSVTTWAEALDHGIVASPTLRAASIELRPSHPDTTEAREWAWRGRTATSVAPEALLDFLVQAVALRSQQLAEYLTSGGPEPYVRQYLHAVPAAVTPGSSACGSGPAARC